MIEHLLCLIRAGSALYITLRLDRIGCRLFWQRLGVRPRDMPVWRDRRRCDHVVGIWLARSVEAPVIRIVTWERSSAGIEEALVGEAQVDEVFAGRAAAPAELEQIQIAVNRAAAHELKGF